MRNAQCRVNLGAAPFAFAAPPGAVAVARFGTLKYHAKHKAEAKFETRSGGEGRGVSAIVLEPARDLAEQTHQCFEAYAKHVASPPVTCALLIGGVNTKAAEAALKAGDVDASQDALKVWDLVKRGVVDVEELPLLRPRRGGPLVETDDVETYLQISGSSPRAPRPARRQAPPGLLLQRDLAQRRRQGPAAQIREDRPGSTSRARATSETVKHPSSPSTRRRRRGDLTARARSPRRRASRRTPPAAATSRRRRRRRSSR